MIRFAHIEYLYALLAVPVFILIFWLYKNWKRKAKKRLGDENVVRSLMPNASPVKPGLKFFLIILAYIYILHYTTIKMLKSRNPCRVIQI